MPTYITLIHYTEQGVQTFKDLAGRIEETQAAGDAVGARLVGYYLTMGQYDAVAISEAPGDETIAESHWPRRTARFTATISGAAAEATRSAAG